MLPVTGIVRVTDENDRALKQFIESWLGSGAPGSGNN
jgi:hypothetical protein